MPTIFRFYNSSNNAHFFTASEAERDQVIATLPSFRYEGVAFQANASGGDPGTQPVYRILNQLTGVHIYTSNATERATLRASGFYKEEGIAYHAYVNPAATDVLPLYRFYNTATKAYFYTSNEAEKAAILASNPALVLEGIAYYIGGVATTGNIIDLTGSSAIVDGTTRVNATNVATQNDDTITASAADLAGSSVDGLGGNDTMVISGTGAPGESVGLTANNTKNIENIVVQGSVANVAIGFGALASVKALTGDAAVSQSLTVAASFVSLSNTEILNFGQLNLIGSVTMTAAQHNSFNVIQAAGTTDSIFTTTVGTLIANDAIELYQITEGSTLTMGTSAAGFARNVTESGTSGLISTLVLGNGTYTGLLSGFDTNDIIKVGTATNIAAIPGLNSGVVVDFQNAASSATGLTLNSSQNGLVTFINTTGNQVVTVTTLDSFTVADGIENYSVIGGSTVTVSSTNTNININSTNAASTSVNIGGNTVTGSYSLAATDDLIVATNGANIIGLNGGGLFGVEGLNLTGGITMTHVQYNDLKSITASGLADKVTVSSSGNINASAAVEAYVLNGTGNDQINFNTINTPGLTDAVRANMSVSLAGGGSDTIQIAQTITDNTDSSITITNYTAGDDKFQLFSGATAQNAGFQTVTAASTDITSPVNSVIEINDGVSGFYGAQLSDIATAKAYIDSNIGTIADGDYAVVIYRNSTDAGLYQISVSGGSAVAASLSIDNIELIGVVEAVGANAFTAADFI